MHVRVTTANAAVMRMPRLGRAKTPVQPSMALRSRRRKVGTCRMRICLETAPLELSDPCWSMSRAYRATGGNGEQHHVRQPSSIGLTSDRP